jgi:hypothetical protein
MALLDEVEELEAVAVEREDSAARRLGTVERAATLASEMMASRREIGEFIRGSYGQ